MTSKLRVAKRKEYPPSTQYRCNRSLHQTNATTFEMITLSRRISCAASRAASASSCPHLVVTKQHGYDSYNNANQPSNSTRTRPFTSQGGKPTAFIRTPQDEKVARDLFLSFAHSHIGEEPSLNTADLRDLLLAIGDSPSDSKLAELVERIDENGDGVVEYDEFLRGCEATLGGGGDLGGGEDAPVVDIDSLVATFRNLDKDGSGDLTIDELAGLISTTGGSLSEATAQEIMDQADSNRDGVISLTEFVDLCTDPNKIKYSWRLRSGFRVCLVMGGPGSGKGTICEKLVKEAGITHYSSGEMLREEIASGSPLAKTIESMMEQGQLVPSTTIIALLKKQLRKMPGALVALDGFPRNLENYHDFDAVCGTPEFAIFVDVSDEEMIRRIMKRAETSGRVDDNIDTARKRLKTFHEQTTPTLSQLNKSNVPIYRLDGGKSPDEIWKELIEACPPIRSRMK